MIADEIFLLITQQPEKGSDSYLKQKKITVIKRLKEMSKNTASSAFRKIDVDQYNEDNYKEEECGESQSPPVGPDEKEITNFLNQGKNIEALKTVLRNAPVSSRNQMVKDAALNVMMQVLLSVKSAQMEEAVNALDRDQLDVLMKYIYRGFETPSEGSSGHLLAWHEKVHAVAGVGCIVRVLTDKKRV